MAKKAYDEAHDAFLDEAAELKRIKDDVKNKELAVEKSKKDGEPAEKQEFK